MALFPGAVGSSLMLKIMVASYRKLYPKLWEMLFRPPEMLEQSATEQNNIAQTCQHGIYLHTAYRLVKKQPQRKRREYYKQITAEERQPVHIQLLFVSKNFTPHITEIKCPKVSTSP